jgi:hypothetical protein
LLLDDFINSLDGRQVFGVWVDDGPAGLVISDGPEIHACVKPWAKGRWFTKQTARVLNAVIEAHGYATTKATTEEGRKFVERLGFLLVDGKYRKDAVWALKH